MNAHWVHPIVGSFGEGVHTTAPLVYQITVALCICIFLLWMIGRGDK